jgi:ribonuclease BN (tRNA processing enzyme)
MHFNSFSIAAYSTWNHCPEFNFLIDAGDSVSTFLGIGQISALNTILLTHAHMDHVGGLAALIHLRKRTPDCTPLRIYYTDECQRTELIRKMAGGAHWTLTGIGEEIYLGGNPKNPLWVTPFPVRHGRESVGYKIFQTKHALHPAHRGRSEEDLRQLAKSGVDLKVRQDVHILTYTGDTKPLPAEVLGTPKWLMHDATYPRDGMQEDHDHSTAEQAIAAAEAIGAGLIVNHLSVRYRDVLKENQRFQDLFPEGTQLVLPQPRSQYIKLD